MLLGADGRPLNTSLSHFSPKPVLLEGGTKAPASPENDRTLDRNADTRAPRPFANQVGGEAYMPSALEAASMEPAIRCPKCQKVCVGFTDAIAEFKLPSLPEEMNRHVYRSEACGCWITQEWAGSINNEICHRQSGGTPRAVVEMPDSQRNTLYKRLEQMLHKLMDALSAASTPELKTAVQAKIDSAIQLMERVSQPMRQAKAFADAVAEVTKQQEAAVAKFTEASMYGQQKLPDLQKAAEIAKMKAMGQSGPKAKKPADLSLAGEPSVERLQQALDSLNGPDWLGTIAGAFTSLTEKDARYAMKTLIRDSIVARLTHGTTSALHPAVHSYLYFLAFGRVRPLKFCGVEHDSINQPFAVPAAPITNPATKPVSTSPLPPPTPPPDLHQQLKRKKRRIKRLKPDTEDGSEN